MRVSVSASAAIDEVIELFDQHQQHSRIAIDFPEGVLGDRKDIGTGWPVFSNLHNRFGLGYEDPLQPLVEFQRVIAEGREARQRLFRRRAWLPQPD